MATNYLGMDLVKKTTTIICAKRAGKDLKIYAIVRDIILPKKYLYSIICLDKEEGDPKIVTKKEYANLSTVRRLFRKIQTNYTKRLI